MKILVLIFLIILFGTYLWRKRKESIYIVCITFLTTFFISSCHSIFMMFKDLDFSVEWLSGTFMFALIILSFPILVSVITFKYLLKNGIGIKNIALRFSIQFLLIFFIIQSSLICWAILDMQLFGFEYESNFSSIVKAYKENYLDYALVSFLIPFCILYLDKWYNHRFRSNNNAIKSGNKNEFGHKS